MSSQQSHSIVDAESALRSAEEHYARKLAEPNASPRQLNHAEDMVLEARRELERAQAREQGQRLIADERDAAQRATELADQRQRFQDAVIRAEHAAKVLEENIEHLVVYRGRLESAVRDLIRERPREDVPANADGLNVPRADAAVTNYMFATLMPDHPIARNVPTNETPLKWLRFVNAQSTPKDQDDAAA